MHCERYIGYVALPNTYSRTFELCPETQLSGPRAEDTGENTKYLCAPDYRPALVFLTSSDRGDIGTRVT